MSAPTPEEIAAYEASRARAVADYQGLRAYHALAAPTNAQSVAAIKALIRMVRLLVGETRDEV